MAVNNSGCKEIQEETCFWHAEAEYWEINLEDGERLSQSESKQEAKTWSQETQHIQEAGSGWFSSRSGPSSQGYGFSSGQHTYKWVIFSFLHPFINVGVTLEL